VSHPEIPNPVLWKDGPGGNTSLDAANLNIDEQAVLAIDTLLQTKLSIAAANATFAPLAATDCIVGLSADYSLASSALTAIPWTVTVDDPLTMHSLVTNTTRLTVATGQAGLYLVGGNFTPTGPITGDSVRLIATLHKNGVATAYESEVDSPSGTVFPSPSVSGLLRLAVGDYVEFMAYQATGSAVAIAAASSAFWAYRVGS
jgi:hypothetical protein